MAKKIINGKLNLVVPQKKVRKEGLTPGRAEIRIVNKIKMKKIAPGAPVVKPGFEHLMESAVLSAYVRGWTPTRISRMYKLPQEYVRSILKKMVYGKTGVKSRNRPMVPLKKFAGIRKTDAFLFDITRKLKSNGFTIRNIHELTNAIEKLGIKGVNKYNSDLIAKDLIKKGFFEKRLM